MALGTADMENKYLKALKMRKDGKTFKGIAEAFSVSIARARDMVAEGERLSRGPFEQLPSRPRLTIRHLLKDEAQITPIMVRALRDSGKLKGREGLGRKSLKEIDAWLEKHDSDLFIGAGI